MFNHYLKSGFRAFRKNKVSSFINLAGLVIGMTCCLFIFMYVQDEWSYDKHHKKSDKIYRVVLEQFDADRINSRTWASVSAGYGQKLKAAYPAIENSVRFWMWSFPVISFEDKKFVESGFYFAEPSVFDIFTHPFIAGDPTTALNDPNSVVLTQSAAQKYFGSQNPMGKTIEYFSRGDRAQLQVTGVIEDVKENSHLTFDMLGSFATWEKLASDEDFEFLRGNYNYPTYVLLDKQTQPNELTSLFPGFLEKNMDDFNGMKPSERYKILLQPLSDVHLNSDFTSDFAGTGNSTFIYIFIAIALLILVIACINFINLTTAVSSRRAGEIGMRKILGAHRFQLVRQFLGESTFLALIALILSVGLTYLLMPLFNEFTEKNLVVEFFGSGSILIMLLGIILFVGLLAGTYPALVLSGFKPLRALSNFKTPRTAQSFLRSGLVTFQFIISIGLLVGVIVIQRQLDYMRTKDLGFNQDQLLTLRGSNSMIKNLELFKEELRQQPGIKDITAASRIPSDGLGDALNAQVINEGKEEIVGFRIPFIRMEEDFFKTIEADFVAGQNISNKLMTDTISSFILNETAAQQLGWTSEEAVGQPFIYGRGRGRIVGVVKDFHFESLHNEIKPTVFFASKFLNRIILKVDPQKLPEVLTFLEGVWNRYRPDYPFAYQFVDESFANRYESEQKLGSIFSLFSGIAIFIACLGLFGLAVFLAEQRTKEIAIRKTLGASFSNIFFLLSSNFFKILLVANLLAIPLAYYGMNRWLENFAYRIEMQWGIFVLAGVLAIAIAFVTVSFQSIRGALADPVHSLRNE